MISVVIRASPSNDGLARDALGQDRLSGHLRDVLERVGIHRASRVDDLLPDRRVLPEPGALASRKGSVPARGCHPSPNPQNARGKTRKARIVASGQVP
jgi:hypothetical protein